jgi:iron complex outermembrane receptor protein
MPPYALAGGPDFDSEVLIAYELGYRIEASSAASFSLATFYNCYDDIYSVELLNPDEPLPYTIQNGTEGESWGAELSGIFQPSSRWKLRGGYTYFHKDLRSKPGHNVPDAVLASLGNDPEHQAVAQLISELSTNLQLDLTARYVNMLPSPLVPSYTTFGARLAWRSGAWEVSVAGRNLAESKHLEYSTVEIPRSIYGRVTCRY